MRKAIGFLSFVLLSALLAPAQHLARKPSFGPAAKEVAADSNSAAGSLLPVTRVSLYKNGVGFFEHSGRVTGNQAITIDFTTAQLDDVLQSLTAIDLNGGRIAGAGYNSTTPLDQQLKALPLALGENPTAVDFYNAIRGARVEVHTPGASITGRLLNIELVSTPEKDNQPATERRLITVIGDAGEVRTVELTSATEVRLLDPGLDTDVTRYLQLLASTRNQDLRHLTIEDNGTGTRELQVSYISEVPIWKSTYRILFTEPSSTPADAKPGSLGRNKTPTQTATLQGWSVVDNTTGSDWINVQLSLIAGAPQSFIQPLSVPYYSRRPEIPLPQEAQLTPQTHESGIIDEKLAPPPVPQQIGVAGMSGMGSGSANGVAGGMVGLGSGSGSGLGAGSGGNSGSGMRKVGGGIPAALPYEQSAEDSVVAKITTAAFDDSFAYNLTDPITIRKNQSALVPILQTRLDAERVTLWSPREPTPLRALWITNTSNLTLDRGSFSIVEDGNFGGEGLLDPIHPAERRLLSYAVDQAVRVTTESQHETTHATSLTAAKGVLVLHHTQIAEITYVVHNAAAESRTVIVEHPIRPNFVLDGAGGDHGNDPKPEETTPTLYRYRVITAPGETVRLHVGERHQSAVTYRLTSFDDNQLTVVLNQTGNNAAVQHALEPILAARHHVALTQFAVDTVNARLTTLRSDEDRQRSNITALANADKASRDRFVHDLNTTEDQIAAAQKDLTTALTSLQSAKDDLASKIETLQIGEILGA